MINIELANELIKKTFGENIEKGIKRNKFDVGDNFVTWGITFKEEDVKIMCTVSKNQSKFQVIGDNVDKDFVITQYNRVNYIRSELYKEEVDENQLTIDDVNSDDTEQVTAEGTITLEAETSDEKVEELSNNAVFEDE